MMVPSRFLLMSTIVYIMSCNLGSMGAEFTYSNFSREQIEAC